MSLSDLLIFAKTMVFKKVVKVANSRICPFSNRYTASIIYQEIYLSWDRLRHYTKDPAFSWCFKIDWPGLHRIAWYMNLLCIVK